MISKMRDDESGSRIGIVMNGSPLFSGGAASGPSEIRRWMLENDWIEAIVALPTSLFYNTAIQTYVWILTNRKPEFRRGKVQLIDASGERFWNAMRKGLGEKRREIPDEARHEIVRIYAEMLNGNGEYSEFSKIFDAEEFGYREVRIERPLRLNFCTSLRRLNRLQDDKAFTKLSEDQQQAIWRALDANNDINPPFGGDQGDDGGYLVWKNRDEFVGLIEGYPKDAGIKVKAPVMKAILSALSERDEEADICADKHGNPEPDTGLRDHELVPLKETWKDYVAREVKPFVPDAWVDESHRDARDGQVGRIGYEINFNRNFYQYVPPRPLEEINAELNALEGEIARLLKEVAA